MVPADSILIDLHPLRYISVRRRAVMYHHSTQKKCPIIGANERIYPPELIVSDISKKGGEKVWILTSDILIWRSLSSKCFPSRARSYARAPSTWSALYFGGTCEVRLERYSESSV